MNGDVDETPLVRESCGLLLQQIALLVRAAVPPAVVLEAILRLVAHRLPSRLIAELTDEIAAVVILAIFTISLGLIRPVLVAALTRGRWFGIRRGEKKQGDREEILTHISLHRLV
jgi:hypothetical protein